MKPVKDYINVQRVVEQGEQITLLQFTSSIVGGCAIVALCCVLMFCEW